MGKITGFAIFVFIVLSASSLYAQSLNVGAYNIQKVLKDSKAVRDYRQKYEKETEQNKKTLAEKQEFAKKLEDKLKKEDKTLSAGERATLEEALLKAIQEMRQLSAAIQKVETDINQRIAKEISAIIKEIANKEGYLMIFERNTAGISHVDDSVDITEKILEKYDKR